jgi:hypothetical protein
MMEELLAFLAARYGEAWRAARDAELAAGQSRMGEATRTVEAHRQLLGLADDARREDTREHLVMERVVRILGAVYEDHPLYRAEWRP